VRKLAVALVVGALVCLAGVSSAFADSLQDSEININGTITPSSLVATGVDASGFNTATGVGTITITVDGTDSCTSCYVDVWLFEPAGVPDYNEYGATSGTAASGQSWQIDIPDYLSDGNITGTILANTDANALDNTNNVPGTVDNFLGSCSGASCNDLVSMALGFNFTNPGAGQEELITLDVNNTGCDAGSICLEDVHPPDPNNANGVTLYFSGTAVAQAAGTGGGGGTSVPEPSTWVMLACSLFALLIFRRKLATN
jgi:hypothetical protein